MPDSEAITKAVRTYSIKLERLTLTAMPERPENPERSECLVRHYIGRTKHPTLIGNVDRICIVNSETD
jgi:hypothetical protein